VLTVPLDDEERKYGFKWFAYHWVDLHSSLREMAEGNYGLFGKPAVITPGSEVIGLDCEEGILNLINGRKVKKDLTVLAGGGKVSLLSH
jgi:salicylate hydroxylase